ncbi:hypothetical protein AtNW77_Chr4g0278911 [Arabidopsis thaliana]
MFSYIPFRLVSYIVRRIGISGFRNLGPFIAAGPEWVAIVFSDEVLKELGLYASKGRPTGHFCLGVYSLATTRPNTSKGYD